MMLRSYNAIIVASVWLVGGHQMTNAQNENLPSQANAKTEVHAFLAESDYALVRQYPKRWSQETTADERKRLVIELAERLTSPQEIGLTGYADTAVFSRLVTHKMRFHGHGTILRQDVFLENGRCAWAIEKMLSCKLPEFSAKVGASEAKLNEAVRMSLLSIIAAMEMTEPAKLANNP